MKELDRVDKILIGAYITGALLFSAGIPVILVCPTALYLSICLLITGGVIMCSGIVGFWSKFWFKELRVSKKIGLFEKI